jgi:hypothetical protein
VVTHSRLHGRGGGGRGGRRALLARSLERKETGASHGGSSIGGRNRTEGYNRDNYDMLCTEGGIKRWALLIAAEDDGCVRRKKEPTNNNEEQRG